MNEILILNNCPSFYKINLYNELAKHRKIFVVFSGVSDQVVYRKDFNANFDYILLNDFQVEKRNKLKDFLKIWRIYKKIRPSKVIYGGYIMIEYILLALFIDKNKNILQTESGKESVVRGFKLLIKKLILALFSKALVSGSIHAEILKKIGFSGNIVVTKGVGIINKGLKPISQLVNDTVSFLYVGRLIELKNIIKIVEVFNKNGLPLTIVGDGSLKNEISNLAKSNISILGRIENEKLCEIYLQHSVFILPSFSEPWGLVLEEALQYNCALVVSNCVSSYPELVEEPNTGVLFDPYSEESISSAIQKVKDNINEYKLNAKHFDIDAKDKHQVQCYIDL